jgi:murein DD-endopeptidase MepM/ murein hydrolase activator NlpD
MSTAAGSAARGWPAIVVARVAIGLTIGVVTCGLITGGLMTGGPVSAGTARPDPATSASYRAWVWPLDEPVVVVRAFDPPALPWLRGHRGVDLAGGVGARVRAAGAGVVVYAGVLAGRGVVSIDHAGGLRTTYEPVTAAVKAGSQVVVGQRLGALEGGHPGCLAPAPAAPAPDPACLHWGLRRGTTYLDPLILVRPVRVRLKPLRTDPSVLLRAEPASPRRAARTPRDGCRPGPTAAGTRDRARGRRVPRRRARRRSWRVG